MMSLSEEKEKKYDRQLRLWDKEGQLALENANICLINAGPTATETMKNLVLPAIGRFTVVDGKKVDETDLSNNFFVSEEYIGCSRAETVTKLLHELNPDIQESNFLDTDPIKLINENIEYFKQFNVVIATDLPDSALLKLSNYLFSLSIPLFIVRCYGLIGYLRLVIAVHTVIESKPDFPLLDLRLNDPFEELEEYASSFDFEKLNSREHAHVPFPVILIQAMKKWKSNHDGKVPTTTKEKDEFKKSIMDMSRKATEENFEEAFKHAVQILKPYSIPPEVSEVLNHDCANNLNKESDDFWILAAAVRKFTENEGKGKLPLMGSIPDLVTETATFITLQNIYNNKAEKDRQIVERYVKEILESVGRSPDSISKEYISRFCKNVLFLRVHSYRTLEEEYNPKTALKENFWQLSDESFNMHWYFLYRSAQKFYEVHGHYPGEDLDQDHCKDKDEFTKIVNETLKLYDIDEGSISDDYIEEFLRYGNSQIHNICAIMGGVAAQEIIKILTHQWTPLNNTYIFNGLDTNSMVLQL